MIVVSPLVRFRGLALHASQIVPDSSQRRRWPLAEKRRIVELTMQQGASVRSVAREYRIHATTVSHWKSMYRNGLLDISHTSASKKAHRIADFLPVTVDTPISTLTSSRITVGMILPNGITMHVEFDSLDFPNIVSIVASMK